jgi:hypothetical protein
MISPKFCIVISWTLSICSVSAAIDFTPTVREYTNEGLVYRRVILKHDGGTITLVPPEKWEVRGAKEKLRLQPPDKSFVEATITAAALPAPKPFDEATVNTLEQQVLAEAPPGSQPQVLSREENPIAMRQYLSLEIVISYRALGQTFQKSVIFVHTPDTQIAFRFTAPQEDFTALNSSFHRTILSWQWIDASPVAQNQPQRAEAR